MSKSICRIVIIITICFTSLVYGTSQEKSSKYQNIGAHFVIKDETEKLKNSWLAPHELFPQTLIELFNSLPSKAEHMKEAYVTVGTERGFMSFAMCERCSHLVLVDYDPNAVIYNIINTLLLKLSFSLEDYRELRFANKLEIWLQRMDEDKIHLEESELLFLEEHFDFWKENFIRPSIFERDRVELFELLHHPRIVDSKIPFARANYLYSSKLYKRLSKSAKNGNIHVFQANLKSENDQDYFVEYLKKNNLKVLYFDLSNTWMRRYISKNQILDLFDKLKDNDLVVNVGRVIFTNFSAPFALLKDGEKGNYWRQFYYFSINISNLMNFDRDCDYVTKCLRMKKIIKYMVKYGPEFYADHLKNSFKDIPIEIYVKLKK